MKSNQQTFHLTGKEFNPHDLKAVFEANSYQIDRIALCLKSFVKKPYKLVIAPTNRPKTREALGMYWGALVPACAMDSVNLPYGTNIYDDYKHHRQQGKISAKHLDLADTMLRLEWHYAYARDIRGKMTKVPKDLSNHDNGALLQFIEKIMEWRIENGYPFIDVEKYKEWRDTHEIF